ncbi:sensor histidine kinase [Mucilaginibacter flavidus]|uniref:sensor histidine kinase n=1 Tax=Mucilaginibacter flavidus TaxID=2949309 RepID=UPI002093E82D|nr:hypothetical protein [Mucilaginibacter flavidus]MCO5950469.1 hypothetical protein [Mucilaginibacter flavidus]
MSTRWPAACFCLNHYRLIAACFFIIVDFCAPLVLAAQNSITVKSISLPKPFDHAEIRHMMLDNDGFLWFVTNQGIWRFDGTDVHPVDFRNPALPQSSVPDAIYRYHNFLFVSLQDVSTNTYRIFCYNIGNKYLGEYKMPGRPVNFMTLKTGALQFMTSDGSRWIFTDESGLKQTDKYFRYKGWVKGEGMEYYTIDENGNTYLFSHKKAGLVKKGIVIWSLPAAPMQKLAFVKRAWCDSKYVYANCGNGMVVYDKNSLQIVYECFDERYSLSLPRKDGELPVYKIIKDFRIQDMCREPGNNQTLVGTDKGLLEIGPSGDMPGESEKQQVIIDFFKNKSIRSIYRTANNKLYVGTYQGHFVYDGNTFKRISSNIAYTVQPVNQNKLLVGMEGGAGFYLLNTQTDEVRINLNPLRTTATTKIIPYNNGFLTGSLGYIYYLTALANGDYKINPWLTDVNLGFVKDMKFINGDLWIASVGGLFKAGKDGSNKKIYPVGRTLGCYAILQDSDGIWVGTNGEGLIKINAAGKLTRQIKFSDGLAGEYVYSLLQLNKLVIAGTSGGISIFDQSSGMLPLAIPDLPPTDGSLYQEINHSALFDDTARHKIILGGTQGLTFLDKYYLKSAAGKPTDRVELSYIKSGFNTSQPPATDIFVSNRNVIEILPGNTFTGLKFSGPYNQKYVLFRIKELSSAWQQRQLSEEVSLFAIPPGKYTLQVRFPSVTDQRLWLTKTIIAVPRFYQTWLFDFLALLLAAMLIYLAWLARVRKIRNEHLLRTTIASDLHDEIGSALTRISLSSELMNIKQQMDTKVVERISTDSKSAIASISDIIWSVDARNDNKDDLVLRMKEHAYNMLDEIAMVHFDVFGLDNVSNLPQLLRQNIYLIFKEAINNIAKHSTGPEVWITLNNQSAGMTIMIKNTIDPKKPTAAYAGQGLKNMQMRAKRMKATLDIINDGKCFLITIKMKRW